MSVALEMYSCTCGTEFASPVNMKIHMRHCAVVRQRLVDEYKRIAAENGTQAVRKALWNAHADKSLPSYSTIAKWFGSWSGFMVAAGGGEVQMGVRSRDYIPPADPIWPYLLDGCRFVTEFATRQNMRLLYVGMVMTAIDEAGEGLSHWAGDVPDDKLALIPEDAKAFLIKEDLGHMIPDPGRKARA